MLLNLDINMKTNYLILFFVFFTFIHLESKAQNIDSIAIVSQNWQEKTLRKGIVWKKAHFENLFNSHQMINIIEIDLSKNNLKNLGLEALPNSRKKTSFLADSLHAIAAINGGFFDMKNGGAVDYIKVNNKEINQTLNPSIRANAYVAFDNKNFIITTDSLIAKKYNNVMLAGPNLLMNGENSQLEKNPFNSNRHPRTAIAIKNNKLILLTADGRHSNASGLNLTELANLFRWYGCEEAMNLDGGGSTAMYISGQPNNGIVNYPSDNKLFDHAGERAVSNIIYIK